MGRNYAIVLAGGRGTRLNSATPKQFLQLGDRPILLWSLETFDTIDEIDHILAIIPADCISTAEQLLEKNRIDKLLKIVPGGVTRQESAYRALESCDFSDDDIVLIHDAARPFVTREIILKCLSETARVGAAGVYIQSRDTIALIDQETVREIPPREKTYCAQTPQGFRYSIIKNAHDRALCNGMPVTDDIGLALNSGATATWVEGDDSNFKITTDLDYRIACFLVGNK